MKKNKGLTFLEVLITSIILTIALGGTLLYTTQNIKLSNLFHNHYQLHSKINLISRQIENNIKIGAKVEVSNDKKSLKIFDNNNSFICGYQINSSNKLCKIDINGNELGCVSPLLDDYTFEGSQFIVNPGKEYISFDLKIETTSNGNNRILSSSLLTFYAKCRST